MARTPEPTIVVGVFDDAAAVERATRALHEAQFAASDIGVEPGEEGRALVGPSGLRGALRGMGVPEAEARLYDEQHRAGKTILTVSAGTRQAETQAILRQSGAVAVDELRARDMAALPLPGDREVRSTPAWAGAAIELAEEELVARTQLVEIGAVVLRKEVLVETRLVKVQVRREQLVVERGPVEPGALPPRPDPVGVDAADLLAARFSALRPGQSIRLELLEDEVVVQTRPVVYQEVVVGKQLVRETRQVSGELGREQARIDSSSGVTAGPGSTPLEDRSEPDA